MASPVTPMIALGVVSYGNQWYNGGSPADVKPLLFAGVGAVLLSAFGALPGAEPVAVLLGWTAFIGMMISPVQHPSPAQNLLKITGGVKTHG